MELEVSTLNLLVECENIEKAWDLGLKSEHFGSPTNQAIYEFMIDYWIKSKRELAPTFDVVKYEFPSFKYADPDESLDWLIGKLKEKYKRNESADALEDLAILIDQDDVDGAIKLMAEKSHEITLSTTTRESFSDMSENVQERRQRYTERAQFDGSVRGAPLGLQEVDEHTFGFMPGELWVGAGYAGTGKTWLLALAAVAAARAGYRPYVQTLELSRKDVEDRIDALMSGVPYGPLSRGRLSREQLDQLKAAQEAMTFPLKVDEPPENERTVQSLIQRAIQRDCNYILIDQLSFIHGKRDFYKSKNDQFTEVLTDMKHSISDVPVLLAAQFNRESKKDGKGGLHHLADSATVERIADGVFGLDQPKEWKLNHQMGLDLMKFRRGPSQIGWVLDWHLENRTEIKVDGLAED